MTSTSTATRLEQQKKIMEEMEKAGVGFKGATLVLKESIRNSSLQLNFSTKTFSRGLDDIRTFIDPSIKTCENIGLKGKQGKTYRVDYKFSKDSNGNTEIGKIMDNFRSFIIAKRELIESVTINLTQEAFEFSNFRECL